MICLILKSFLELSFLSFAGLSVLLIFKVRCYSKTELLTVVATAGYFSTYIITLVFGFAGLLYSELILLLTIFSIPCNWYFHKKRIWNKVMMKSNETIDASSVKEAIGHVCRNPERLFYWFITVFILFDILYGYCFQYAFSPSINGDSLNLARLFRIPAILHRHVVEKDVMLYWIPLTPSVIDQFHFLLGSLELVVLNRLFSLILIWGFCSLFSKRYFGKDFSPLVMLILLASPVSYYLTHTSILRTYFYAGAFALCAIWFHLKIMETSRDTCNKRELVFSGLILGFAASMTLQNMALFFFALLSPISIWFMDKYMKTGVSSWSKIKFISIYYLIPALPVASIWPIRTFVLTGCFVYPFGSKDTLWPVSTGFPEGNDIFHFFKKIIAYSYPWDVLRDGSYPFGPFIGIGIILLILRVMLYKQERGLYVYILSLFLFVVLLNELTSVFVPRHQYFIIILLAFVVGQHVSLLVDYFRREMPFRLYAIFLIVLACLSILLYDQYSYGRYTLKIHEAIGRFIRVSDRFCPHYLSYDAVKFINNRNEVNPAAVWIWPIHSVDYNLNITNIKVVGWPMMPLAKKALAIRSPEELYELFKKENVDYLIHYDMVTCHFKSWSPILAKKGYDVDNYLSAIVFYEIDKEGRLVNYNKKYLRLIFHDGTSDIFELVKSS